MSANPEPDDLTVINDADSPVINIDSGRVNRLYFMNALEL
jgi:hypothetical protein